MDLDRLAERLRIAHSKHSLRQLARWCGVSHEFLRTIMVNGCKDTIAVARYNSIDNGLSSNGF